MNLISDLQEELEFVVGHGHREFVIEDEDGRRFDLVDVEFPASCPAVLRIRPDRDTPSR